MCQIYYLLLNAVQLIVFVLPLSPLKCFAGGIIKVKNAVQKLMVFPLVKVLISPMVKLMVMVFLCNIIIVGINLAFSF